MSDVKIIIRAVKVGDGHISGTYFFRMIENPFLKGFIVVADDVQRMVDIIYGEIPEILEIEISSVISSFLGCWDEDARKNK